MIDLQINLYQHLIFINLMKKSEIINLSFYKINRNDREMVKSNYKIQKIDTAYHSRIKTFESTILKYQRSIKFPMFNRRYS